MGYIKCNSGEGKTKNIVIANQTINESMSTQGYNFGETYDVTNINEVFFENTSQRGADNRSYEIYIDEILIYNTVLPGTIIHIDTSSASTLRIKPVNSSIWIGYTLIFSTNQKIKCESIIMSPNQTSGSSMTQYYGHIIDLSSVNSLYVKCKPTVDSSTNRAIVVKVDGTSYTINPNDERTFDVSNNSIAKIESSAYVGILRDYIFELS